MNIKTLSVIVLLSVGAIFFIILGKFQPWSWQIIIIPILFAVIMGCIGEIVKQIVEQPAKIHPDHVYRFIGESANGNLSLSLLEKEKKPLQKDDCEKKEFSPWVIPASSEKDGIYNAKRVEICPGLQKGHLCILSRVTNERERKWVLTRFY